MPWGWLSAGGNREDSCGGCPVMMWIGWTGGRGRNTILGERKTQQT